MESGKLSRSTFADEHDVCHARISPESNTIRFSRYRFDAQIGSFKRSKQGEWRCTLFPPSTPTTVHCITQAMRVCKSQTNTYEPYILTTVTSGSSPHEHHSSVEGHTTHANVHNGSTVRSQYFLYRVTRKRIRRILGFRTTSTAAYHRHKDSSPGRNIEAHEHNVNPQNFLGSPRLYDGPVIAWTDGGTIQYYVLNKGRSKQSRMVDERAERIRLQTAVYVEHTESLHMVMTVSIGGVWSWATVELPLNDEREMGLNLITGPSSLFQNLTDMVPCALSCVASVCYVVGATGGWMNQPAGIIIGSRTKQLIYIKLDGSVAYSADLPGEPTDIATGSFNSNMDALLVTMRSSGHATCTHACISNNSAVGNDNNGEGYTGMSMGMGMSVGTVGNESVGEGVIVGVYSPTTAKLVKMWGNDTQTTATSVGTYIRGVICCKLREGYPGQRLVVINESATFMSENEPHCTVVDEKLSNGNDTRNTSTSTSIDTNKDEHADKNIGSRTSDLEFKINPKTEFTTDASESAALANVYTAMVFRLLSWKHQLRVARTQLAEMEVHWKRSLCLLSPPPHTYTPSFAMDGLVHLLCSPTDTHTYNGLGTKRRKVVGRNIDCDRASPSITLKHSYEKSTLQCEAIPNKPTPLVHGMSTWLEHGCVHVAVRITSTENSQYIPIIDSMLSIEGTAYTAPKSPNEPSVHVLHFPIQLFSYGTSVELSLLPVSPAVAPGIRTQLLGPFRLDGIVASCYMQIQRPTHPTIWALPCVVSLLVCPHDNVETALSHRYLHSLGPAMACALGVSVSDISNASARVCYVRGFLAQVLWNVYGGFGIATARAGSLAALSVVLQIINQETTAKGLSVYPVPRDKAIYLRQWCVRLYDEVTTGPSLIIQGRTDGVVVRQTNF
eukprot:CFRG2561T1